MMKMKDMPKSVHSSEGDSGTNEKQSAMRYTDYQRTRAADAKRGIAIYVAKQIPKNSPVFLDAGSTVGVVAEELFRRENLKCRQCLTIMTNNMGIFNCFNARPSEKAKGSPSTGHSLTLLLTGGQYDENHDALFGTQAANALKDFYPRVVVIGTSGFTSKPGKGLFVFGHTAEQAIKKAIIEKETRHRIIVCDYTKIGQTDSFLVGSFEHLLKNTSECTIVTSVIPEKEPERQWYQELMDEETTRIDEWFRNYQRGGGKGRLRLVQVRNNGDLDRKTA